MQRWTSDSHITKSLCEALKIPRGITAVIGAGGKTSLCNRLGQELCHKGKVILTTTTHIWQPQGLPLACNREEAEKLLRHASLICVGQSVGEGKLGQPADGVAPLARLADYVIVEADGAKGLPLKAHGGHEPAIPSQADRKIAVCGLKGLGKPIAETVHRPEICARLLGVDQKHRMTPRDLQQLLEAYPPFDVLVANLADAADCLDAGRRRACLCRNTPVTIAALAQPEPILEQWEDGALCWC